jgi:multidrug efflux pump
MIENIVRHMEEGESPMQAALEGAREIGFTVISLTLSLIAVFIPLLFMTGLVGRMFREFALTLTIAVVISAIVSLTLTPMMCSRMLRHGAGSGPSPLAQYLNGLVDRVVAAYHKSLLWVLRRERATLLTTGATLVITIALYAVVPKGFLPLQDTGLVQAVLEAGPEVSFAEMIKMQDRVAVSIRTDPDVEGVVTVVGVSALNPTPNAGHLKVILKPRDARNANVSAIIERLKEKVGAIPGITVYFQPVQDVQISTRISRAQFQYTLVGSDEKDVATWAARLTEKLRFSPALQEVISEAQDGGLRIMVRVDRETAGRLGVSMQAVNDALNDAFGQRQISTIYAQANQYRVVLEAAPQYQSDPAALGRIYVPASTQASGQVSAQVPLSAVAKIERRTAPLAVNHQDQFPSVTISFNLAPGGSLSDAVAAITTAQEEIGMPTSVTGTYSGDADEFTKSLRGQPWLILAALITIYIVLGVLYESFVHPFTILTTLPSAGIGALLALMLCGMDLSMIGLIGIVLLMGIVKKNAIMMIDFALEAERTQGLPPREAIIQASLLRFRPIMMTTLAALFGALPLALESGTGSELRNPLGVTIIGGLLLSQLLTLYTTPVIYLAMERVRARLAPAAAAQEQPARAAYSPAEAAGRPAE